MASRFRLKYKKKVDRIGFYLPCEYFKYPLVQLRHIFPLSICITKFALQSFDLNKFPRVCIDLKCNAR